VTRGNFIDLQSYGESFWGKIYGASDGQHGGGKLQHHHNRKEASNRKSTVFRTTFDLSSTSVGLAKEPI
jgi:hypothetical protein